MTRALNGGKSLAAQTCLSPTGQDAAVASRIADEVDGSCSTGIERAKVQLSSTARKGATQ
jgi:hypothetical protein